MRKQSLGGYGKVWNEEVDGYEQFQSIVIPKKDEMLATIVEMVPFESASSIRILEIGGGKGALTEKTLTAFPKSSYVFSDASEGMVKASVEKFSGRNYDIHFEEADFNKQGWNKPLGNKKFDLILSSLCFHYIATKRRAPFFKELGSMVKKGGVLIYSTAVQSPHEIIQKKIERNHRAYLKHRFAEVMGLEVTDEDMDKMYREKRGRLGVNAMPVSEHLGFLKKSGFARYELIWRYRHYAIFMAVR